MSGRAQLVSTAVPIRVAIIGGTVVNKVWVTGDDFFKRPERFAYIRKRTEIPADSLQRIQLPL